MDLYIKKVPRVHLGLLYIVGTLLGVSFGLTIKLLKNTFPNVRCVSEISSLKRACGACRPYAEGYAEQG